MTRHASRLLSLPGVVGLGEGRREDGPCLIVLVACPEGELPDMPATLDGYPVVVERTGRLQARSLECSERLESVLSNRLRQEIRLKDAV